jgi:CRISPR type III-B/RAMP module RAMP protein Cmr6
MAEIRFPLPGTTEVFLRSSIPRIHPNLLLTKLLPWHPVEERQGERTVEWGKDSPPSRPVFLQICSAVKARAQLRAAWHDRRASWLAELAEERVQRVCVRTLSEVVLWLATPTPLELGFCLHHVYGLPYLPGSGLKGLARAAAEREGADAQELDRLFGTPRPGARSEEAEAGAVDFCDGIPLDDDLLELDIMTPHHSDYYSGKNRWPHDCEGPTPLTFLRIRRDKTFEIALVCRSEGSREALERARHYLLLGLEEMGLGAKTTSGYGRFKEPGARSDPSAPPRSGSARQMGFAIRLEKNHIVVAGDDGHEYLVHEGELNKAGIYKHKYPRKALVEKRARFSFRVARDRVGDRVVDNAAKDVKLEEA